MNETPNTRRRARAIAALNAANAKAEADNARVQYVDNVPDIGIPNRDVRLWVGFSLFALSMISGLLALTLGVFPEIEIGNAVLSRSVELANQIIAFVTGAFGLIAVSPNVPTRASDDA